MIHVYLKYWAQAYKRSFIRDPILNVSIESVSDMFLHFDKKWLKFIPSGGMSKECQQDILDVSVLLGQMINTIEKL